MSEEKEISKETTEEKNVKPKKAKKKKNRRKSSHKGAFALGLAVVILAVIGAGFLINLGIGQIRKMNDSSKDITEYEDFLYPVVTLDTRPFDDISSADMKELICASILSLLTDSESNPYDFEFVEGETAGMGIPQETVEKAFKELFGSDIKPVHQSVECSTCIFTYQSTAKRYVIPITGYDSAYVPDVLEADESKEGIIELTVGYVAYGDWQKNEDGYTQPEPAKYRKITLRKSGKGYYISSIQNTDAPEKK